MRLYTTTGWSSALIALGSVLSPPGQPVQDVREDSRCLAIEADLVENGGASGCKPGHSSCFVGEVAGNHGFRGTTYFRADGSVAGPSTSPGFLAYSGLFEYTTDEGTIVARETGVAEQTLARPPGGAVTAHQQVVSSAGEWAGVSGYFFVSGFRTDQRVVTRVRGELCFPK
jgi:hypothetical protein